MSDEILKGIIAEYRPYNTYLAFREGFAAYEANGNALGNPYHADTVDAQSWDRGACAAMRYARALDAAQRGAVVETAKRPAKPAGRA